MTGAQAGPTVGGVTSEVSQRTGSFSMSII